MTQTAQTRQLTAPHAVLLEEPRDGVPQTSEMILGERFDVLEEWEGWLRVANRFDGHVGWLPPGTPHADPVTPTHRVRALRADLHPAPTHKAPPLAPLSVGSLVTLDGRADNGWVGVGDGLWLFGKGLEPVEAPPVADHVATALRFLETPYVWGGRSAFGIDCSGLVLTAMAAAGVVSHHSSGKQRQDGRLGAWISDDGRDVAYERGDIVFFPGHVGIMLDGTRLLHATVFTMSVVVEPLADVAARAESINGVRRPHAHAHGASAARA
ncbi:C40 family peptidase [Azospirillum agricola]|uniref:C40 family peptidase n=1 Tax=Azospirillum agricola TaxID=1720247 RepID=UPI000A0F2F54|nr:NlpC/P60 family protein [Azospirillum agricola]SMH38357.1 NlpC/P60 family protein [Azospirillum lipoferum]